MVKSMNDIKLDKKRDIQSRNTVNSVYTSIEKHISPKKKAPRGGLFFVNLLDDYYYGTSATTLVSANVNPLGTMVPVISMA
jgi:hypothetical protein